MTKNTGSGQWYRRQAEIPSVRPAPGWQRRTLVWGQRSMMCEMSIARGGEVPPHHHPYEQIGYIASGRLQFTVDGDTEVLEPGDAYLIPPDVTHSVVALEDAVAIDVFGPPRPDYMD